MREKVASVRLRHDQASTDDLLVRTYNTAMRQGAEEILERWKGGRTPPPHDGSLVTTKVANTPGGPVVGFNVYLQWNEPFVFGEMQTEIEP